MALTSFLPAPTQLSQDQLEAEEKARSQRSRQTSLVSSRREPPPYGYRKGWIPRLLEDFGDGGAFPEIHVAQYPLDMGRKKKMSNALGMDSGFAGGEDEIYNVYDQAWRGGKDMAQNIYRPSKNLDKDMYGDDLEARIKTNRFVPDKEFSGSDRRQRGREGPVQFEEDPFGLDKFLEEAKQHGGSKRPSDSSRPKEHEHEGKKRRKE
ncbi:SNW domain-containing protein 1 [Leptonychotes weddellii]|uniref:SNW domain-containing protein 1 n=1 Tax=Leptonychotes weddellii TaxID=9713 RepID=A0A7F8PZ00_LEPWE|nr:SNW domain-containing protein 1 [Leptonychotes weddellii]